MSEKIVLATNNAKKLAELKRILAEEDINLEVCSLADFDTYPEPEETEWTFQGNALIKARAACQALGLPALADDSGICVDALNQMPGVRSSRWAGPSKEDVANLELVLKQISDVPKARRGGSFRAALALVLPDGREFVTEGKMPGRVAMAARGSRGFGYDPIFVPSEQEIGPDGKERTCAELSAAEKDAISHRGKAIRAMMPILRAELLDN